MKLLLLTFKNLWRNKVRSVLTALAVIFLVALFSIIVTVLLFLEGAMTEKSKDVQTVMTERRRIPSRFDRRYYDYIVSPGTQLNQQLSQIPGFHGEKSNIWHFIVFSLDPEQKDITKMFFCIACLPEKIGPMTDGLRELGFDADGKLAALMKNPPRSSPNTGILLGSERLRALGKQVGDVFPAKSISHRNSQGEPIEMTFEIVGTLPDRSRWAQGGFMDYEYLDRVLEAEKSELDGQINLGWLMLDSQEALGPVAGAIESDNRDIKAESAATATVRFLESFKDLLWGVKWLLTPAIVVVMTIIVANAISITVRERTKEIAVLKVLGFGKGKILAMVLGEGMLIGMLAGLCSAGLTYFLVNYVIGGVPVPIGWFGTFFVSEHAFWWGPVLGAGAAFLGGILPAWSACQVKVSEVFAKVA